MAGPALVVVSHPRAESYNRAVAHAVLAELRGAGRHVLLHDLHADGFDPALTAEEAAAVSRGESSPSADPLVARYRHELESASLLVVVHPNWWGKPPALMSGWLDRVLAPGVAYKMTGGPAGDPHPLLDLDDLVITTGDTPPDVERDRYGDPLDDVWRRCVLPFIGARRFDRIHISPVNGMTDAERRAALDDAVAAVRALAG